MDISKIKRDTERVERCLENHTRSRNDDIDLLRLVWQTFYDVKWYTITRDQMKTLITQERVKRIRAKLNSEGKYYPTNMEVVRARRLNEDVYRTYYWHKNKSLFENKAFA